MKPLSFAAIPSSARLKQFAYTASPPQFCRSSRWLRSRRHSVARQPGKFLWHHIGMRSERPWHGVDDQQRSKGNDPAQLRRWFERWSVSQRCRTNRRYRRQPLWSNSQRRPGKLWNALQNKSVGRTNSASRLQAVHRARSSRSRG